MQTTPTFEKSIQYDRISKDYKAELDGQLIGYFNSYHEAEIALDQVAHDMLIHGDCNTATDLDGAQADDVPTDAPGEDCDDHGPYADDDCPKCSACHTNDYPPSAMQPAFCIECVNAMLHGLSNRFEARAEADHRRAVKLGRVLCQMRWRNFRSFVALLKALPTAHLCIYAESYIAFMRSYNPGSTLTTKSVLSVWMRLIADAGDRGPAAPALLQRAA